MRSGRGRKSFGPKKIKEEKKKTIGPSKHLPFQSRMAPGLLLVGLCRSQFGGAPPPKMAKGPLVPQLVGASGCSSSGRGGNMLPRRQQNRVRLLLDERPV